jgi:hypothetical protein
MIVLWRPVCEVLALGIVFSSGWTLARLRGAPLPATAEAAAIAERPADGEATCRDPQAMAANANLVEQVGEYRKRFELAREQTSAAVRSQEALTNAPPVRFVPTRDQWARMARDATVHVRMPCSQWNASASYSVVRGDGSRTIDVDGARSLERTKIAGLSDAELDLLAETYGRATAKVWAAMQASCERNPTYRENMAEHEADASASARIDTCARTELDTGEASANVALVEVAAIHAAGGGIERTRNDTQRIAFALTNASKTLYEEMVHSLGRNNATRAIEGGIGCLDETVYDFRQPPPAPAPSED